MKIELDYMNCWPDRDAVAFYAAEVFDDAGARYPVRIMLDGFAAACFEQKLEGSYRDIVEALYRKELEQLLRDGKLTPRGRGNLNVVFLVSGSDRQQTRPTDIVIDDAVDKLKATAKKLGRL